VVLLIGTIITSVNSVSACTGFTASDKENVLVGDNVDWYYPDFNLRFFPAEKGKFGKVHFDNDWPLPWNPDYETPYSGMNDQGLFYASFATPYLEIINQGKKLPIFTDDYYIWDIKAHCLSYCSTVQEVIDVYKEYNLKITGLQDNQHFYVDRHGDSVIIEGDEIIYKEGDFQVVTNFVQSHPDLPTGPTAFSRYNTAVSMLENMTDLSVDYFRSICNATRLEETDTPTVMSQVCDLKNGIIYLCHFHDYDNVLVINLEDELKKGEQVWYDVPSLFEPIGNQPPEKPNPPTGVISGNIKTEYTYMIDETTDPDNNEKEIYYKFDWGDETSSRWLNRYWFEWGLMKHSWKKQGNYNVRVKAKDIYGAESDWSDSLTISLTRDNNMTKLIIIAISIIGITATVLLLIKLINRLKNRYNSPCDECLLEESFSELLEDYISTSN